MPDGGSTSTVVVGFDGSECARSAVDTAVSLARSYGDRLVVVFGTAPPGTPTEELSAHRAAIEDVGERVAAEAVERAREQDVEVEVVVVPERPHAALIRTAKERDARFIVVGSYGESPIKGALLGSVPHKLLHTSETPVVVVRV